MTVPIVLASGSETRARLLRNAGVKLTVVAPRVDEDAVKGAMLAESASPRDIADALAEIKARKIAAKRPDAMVIGCDQVLEFEGALLSKPDDSDEALTQLRQMAGKRHVLLSAAVIFEGARPVWRHVGHVRLRMRPASDGFLQGYVARNWDSIRHTVGGYKLEEEGARLFSGIDGDYFNVLGMPLLEILNYLALRGAIEQ